MNLTGVVRFAAANMVMFGYDTFGNSPAWTPQGREQINTQFLLYSARYPKKPMTFTNDLNSLKSAHFLERFNPKINTKFYVEPFFGEDELIYGSGMVLKDALLATEKCNFFFVDYSDADDHNYAQTAANCKAVGEELALFIRTLQNTFGIKPKSIHIIGLSLGAHIAGYAGKQIKNIGRITGLDPAGPLFRNAEPEERLDKGDALFVDVIHTNGATSMFKGMGLAESMGHFDFFPNGGRNQPGCSEVTNGLKNLLKYPQKANIALFNGQDGMERLDDEIKYIIQEARSSGCGHLRALELFTSTVLHPECELMGLLCDSYENYASGNCGSCTDDNATCVRMGIQANRYTSYIDSNRSLNFYLNTLEKQPFCLL